MKHKVLFVTFIVLLTVFHGGINAFAMNTGFSTSEMSAKDQQVFLSNVSISLTFDEPQEINTVSSVFSNGGRILSPIPTKAATTTATWLATDIAKYKVIPLSLKSFLGSSTRGIGAYGFAAYAWGHTEYSIFSNDPVARATQRGYALR